MFPLQQKGSSSELKALPALRGRSQIHTSLRPENTTLGENQNPGKGAPCLEKAHLVVLIDGAEDHLGSILGNLELCLCDRGPVVHDDHDVLGLRAHGRDVDGPEGEQNPNHHHHTPSNPHEMLTRQNKQELEHPSKQPRRNNEL